jgi:hypothetical protein
MEEATPMASTKRRVQFRPLTALLILVGIAFLALAIVYFTVTADGLPSFFPGHKMGSAHHHVKHGLAMAALAIVAWIGAWFSTAPSSTT